MNEELVFQREISENAARVNARLAAAGRCFMHNPEIDQPAAVIIHVPIGNELPLCPPCWEWWQASIADPATTDPASVPLWVRVLPAETQR